MHANSKSIATHLETPTAESMNDSQRSEKAVEEDVGLHIFVSNIHAVADDIDPYAEKRLVRKIDCVIIPLICVTYLITYIDKATLSYGVFEVGVAIPNANLQSCTFRLVEGSSSTRTQYSWLGTASASVASDAATNLTSRIYILFRLHVVSIRSLSSGTSSKRKLSMSIPPALRCRNSPSPSGFQLTSLSGEASAWHWAAAHLSPPLLVFGSY